MELKLLSVALVLLSSPLLTLCDPLFVLSAPNLLRVGSSEKVFVESQDHTGGDLSVTISVKNFPKKDVELVSKTVTLNLGNNFQMLTDIKIPPNPNVFSTGGEKQYVFLQAQFPTKTLEKLVMVSFQSGYIFVQTDKPIYTPGTNVQYRIFSLTPNLKPMSDPVMVEIRNPQGITVVSNKIYPVKGIKSGDYVIPEVTSPGIWKVVAQFANTPQKDFITEFEVKEYVLPTFEVKLTINPDNPRKTFFYVGDQSLPVNIEAKYLFGQAVSGNAFMVFGVMEGEKKTTIPPSLQKIQIVGGEGSGKLTKEMITKTFPDINKLVGKSFFVSVSLLTESGSEMVEAERRGIQIVKSPYKIHFIKTPQFYKPGMPFGVSVFVTNPDQTPAKNVPVEINPGGVRGQTKDNGIAKVTVNTLGGSSTLGITVKTKDPQISDAEQAVKTMTAHPYIPKGNSKNYLHVGIDAAVLEIGEQMTVNLNHGESPGFKDQDYTYMILSKGQIVQANRFKRRGQAMVTLSLPVTKDMVPSFRFVAYYHVGTEVVSDSVWVDVKDTCMGKLTLEVKGNKNSYGTGEEVTLDIVGDPGAKVGLVVVDKAVHLLNKNRLTQTKIWDVIEKHDIGCTAGGGKESMGVFTDAGLMFESSTAGGTNTRTALDCPVPAKRKRRAESLVAAITTMAAQFPDGIRQCCVDGIRKNKLGYTCERRSTYILDGPECVKAFLHCCNEIKKRKDTKFEEEELILARNDEEDEEETDFDDIMSRSQFPESWLWDEIDLCDTCTSKTKKTHLKDSITTWQILAISLSPEHGICVAEPAEVIVSKNFFIDLKVPYSAVRGEQLEIKAIIHNYTPNDLKKVRVEFLESADVCSAASKKGKYKTSVNVDAGSSVAVSYVIIPMALGSHNIEVKAAVFDMILYSDGVRKPLKVVSEGVLVNFHSQKLELDPARSGGKPLVLRAALPSDQIPGTPVNNYITVNGEEISSTVAKAISGDFMGSMIKQPYGCGEQNMITMTMPLIATHYLDSTNQWEGVGVDRRSEAINHINTGYQRQLSYRKQDGTYSPWSKTTSSTWLTAYVAKVFSMANEYIGIKEDVICSAIKWLVLNKQLPDGSFKEDALVHDRSMMGGVQGNDGETSLTAFVVVAMQASREICGGSVGSLHGSIRKGIGFLEGQLQRLTNPYAVALTSYAMANENKLRKDILMRHSSNQNGRSWNVPGHLPHSLEATAYAVLALVKAKDYEKAGEAVHWMGKQQTHYGGYYTTQVTMMVFQAVAAYRMQVKDSDNFNMVVELSVAGKSKSDKWTIKRSNIHHTRSGRVEMNKDFTVTATGTGKATLSVLTLYYAKPVEKKTDCTTFDLSVRMDKDPDAKDGGGVTSYNFIMDFFYKNAKADATMTILDISIPTGFDIDEKDLEELSTGKERYIQKYEKNKVLSERGSLIIYLNKVSHKETERLSFRMFKTIDVGMLQPASVTIYEYYSPDARCTKYYHPNRTDGALYRLCKGAVCQCAEENCTYQKKKKVEESKRFNKACEGGLDYVYKVKMERMNLTLASDIYHVKVEHVLKEGTDGGVQGKEILFLARPDCRESLGLEEGKSYLVMGNSVDLPNLGGSLQYVFGEQTWVEYWPTSTEGQAKEHTERYIGMTALKNFFDKEGCGT